MSWASRRRTGYALGVILFFLVVIGGPLLYSWISVPPTCDDRKQNQGETAVDRGGPCLLLDDRAVLPASILWARAFRVRDGSYNAITYVQNSNPDAGIEHIGYRFRLYDSENVLIAEREGSTYLMPQSVTPVFEGAIQTGNRIVTHTYFEFTSAPVWERMENAAESITVDDKRADDIATTPRIVARAGNSSVSTIRNIRFTVAVFDTAGNAIAASHTVLPELRAHETQEIVFTWPDPFPRQAGRIDIIPLVAPVPRVR